MSRDDVPFTGDERALLLGWLDWHRETVHVKCAGLAEAGRLAHPAAVAVADQRGRPGVASHGGRVVLVRAGPRRARRAGPTGRDEDPDLEWRRAPGATLAGTLRRYRRQCAVSRALMDGVDLGGACAGRRHGADVSVRWVLLHMIEETARHNGHLDAVRELVDGIVGE